MSNWLQLDWVEGTSGPWWRFELDSNCVKKMKRGQNHQISTWRRTLTRGADKMRLKSDLETVWRRDTWCVDGAWCRRLDLRWNLSLQLWGGGGGAAQLCWLPPPPPPPARAGLTAAFIRWRPKHRAGFTACCVHTDKNPMWFYSRVKTDFIRKEVKLREMARRHYQDTDVHLSVCVCVCVCPLASCGRGRAYCFVWRSRYWSHVRENSITLKSSSRIWVQDLSQPRLQTRWKFAGG